MLSAALPSSRRFRCCDCSYFGFWVRALHSGSLRGINFPLLGHQYRRRYAEAWHGLAVSPWRARWRLVSAKKMLFAVLRNGRSAIFWNEPGLHCSIAILSAKVCRKQMPNSSTKALAGLRIGVGVLFLIFCDYKVVGRDFTLGGGFQNWIGRFLQDGAYPFMVPVLKNFVLPHAKPIAFLVAYGELAIGIALVLGILVRPASVCGVIYMLSLLFSANYPGPHAAFWQYFGASLEHLVLAFCFAAFASTKPQEILSIRAYLRSPRSV
jgi:thiosulfate dehydrogenase (quinone) large subunit